MSECNLCQEIEEAVPANYDTSIMFLNTADHLYFQFRFQEIWRPVEALLTDNTRSPGPRPPPGSI